MPRISDLPTDTAPDVADLVPFVDVTASRTEAVTVANLAASAAFSGTYALSADLNTVPITAFHHQGTGGNYVGTPDAASLSPTTILDLRAVAALDDWTPAALSTIVAKYNSAGSREYELVVGTTGLLSMTLSVDGTTTATINSTAAMTVTNGDILAIRGVWAAATPNVTFYTKTTTALDAHADVVDDAGWTQLGTAVTTSVPASIFASTANVTLGERQNTGQPMTGKLYAACIEIDGTLVAEWDGRVPASRYRDSTGKTWTPTGSLWAWTV